MTMAQAILKKKSLWFQDILIASLIASLFAS